MLLATLLLALPAPAPLPAAQDTLSASALRSAIDRTVRWVHGRQDPASGAYGDVPTTVAVLEDLLACHREYRGGDGPFVDRAVLWLVGEQGADGALAAAGASPDEARRTSLRAASVLERLGRGEEAARARAFAGDVELPAPALPADPIARAAELLAGRAEDGGFGQGDGRLRATADALGELIRLERAARAAETRAAAKAPEPLPAFGEADHVKVRTALERGAAFLLTQRVGDTGLFGVEGRVDAGLTAMVASALLAVPEPRSDELRAAIDRVLDWLVSLQKPDGSIHDGALPNYVTSAAVMALAAGGREEDRAAIAQARAWLKELQADEGEGYTSENRFYGGVGYGDDERPDLSNLQMALQALADAGVEPGDAAFEKALVFLQRCQNRSETNDLELARDGGVIVSGEDGGAGYAPGDSKAGFVDLGDGRKAPRSYGSMTYALLKCYLFAGLAKDDERVQAAWKWLRENYTLDVNPGFEASSNPADAYQGLFYYFYTMAKALDLYGEERIVDAQGTSHAWRAQLAGRVVAMQRQDGSWRNENSSRWLEGMPLLATSYAMVTLSHARPATTGG